MSEVFHFVIFYLTKLGLSKAFFDIDRLDYLGEGHGSINAWGVVVFVQR